MVLRNATMTVTEFQRFQDMPENTGRILELIEGEIVEKIPSFIPSKIGMRIGRLVGNFVDDRDLGYVTGEAGGYILSDEDTFNPDVGYISKARLPEEPAREAPVAPDLAVEVKSPTDRKRNMRRKAERYLLLGTRMVWLVFPDEQEVEVYVPDKDVQTIGIDGILDGGDILPGFQLAVRDIFK